MCEQELLPFKLSFRNRFANLWDLLKQHIFDKSVGLDEYRFLKRKFPDLPNPNQLFMRLAYVFRNSYEVLEIRPTSKTKYIGGITMGRGGNLTDVYLTRKLGIFIQGAAIFLSTLTLTCSSNLFYKFIISFLTILQRKVYHLCFNKKNFKSRHKMLLTPQRKRLFMSFDSENWTIFIH
jgi:hypothetical protein